MPSTPSKTKPKLSFQSLGTSWEIERPAGFSSKLEARVANELERIDIIWSRFRNDSLVTKMSHRSGTYTVSADDIALLRWYKTLYAATNGAVTPLIGQTLSDAGYDSTYTLQPKEHIHPTPSWESRLLIDTNKLTVLAPTLLDVGAAGKGFAIDRIASLLGDDYIIDAGGDIRTSGAPQTIGLEHPEQPGTVIGTVTINNQSICGSAGNRRMWANGTWHHILDPRTSQPTKDVLATWVIADTAMVADGLATALFFVAPEKLQSVANFHYIVMAMDGSVTYSHQPGLELFT